MNDPFGAAINDYFRKGTAPDLNINTNYTEDESIQASYFFRTIKNMPAIEKKALSLCRGKILDIGAAAGCHSLELQKMNLDVTALEQSKLAIEVMRERGVHKTVHNDIFFYKKEKFDTLLLLMNGTGIGGTLNGLKTLLAHLKTLLNTNGQILIDSSDIRYLFEEDDGSVWVDLNSEAYYGEMQYKVEYKSNKSVFDWLFIDFKLLKLIAEHEGFTCKKVLDGDHHDYLAQLLVKE